MNAIAMKEDNVLPIRIQAREVLPFVSDGRGGQGVKWWNVPTTGDYSQDCRMGEWMAEALVRRVQQTGERWLLGSVAMEMVESKAARGQVVGFMGRIAGEIA